MEAGGHGVYGVLERVMEVREIKSMKSTGALIANEADWLSAMRFRMIQVNKALWADEGFYKYKGVSENKRHGGIGAWCRRVLFVPVRVGAGRRNP